MAHSEDQIREGAAQSGQGQKTPAALTTKEQSMSVFQRARDAYVEHRETAEEAERILASWCETPLPHVPGMSTVIRLAYRINAGRSPEQAAGREYAYRWNLALLSPIFGVPHTIGL